MSVSLDFFLVGITFKSFPSLVRSFIQHSSPCLINILPVTQRLLFAY